MVLQHGLPAVKTALGLIKLPVQKNSPSDSLMDSPTA
jgi:hypothetical protein